MQDLVLVRLINIPWCMFIYHGRLRNQMAAGWSFCPSVCLSPSLSIHWYMLECCGYCEFCYKQCNGEVLICISPTIGGLSTFLIYLSFLCLSREMFIHIFCTILSYILYFSTIEFYMFLIYFACQSFIRYVIWTYSSQVPRLVGCFIHRDCKFGVVPLV